MLQPSDPDLGFGPYDTQPLLVPHESPDLGDMRAHDVALSHLNARGFIQFHPMLAQQLDDFKAAIFLGHALYWSKHLAQIQPHRKGWFFMSAAQWTQATGLSTREQVSVRAALTSQGILREALAGRPAVLHFKVDLETTAKLLGLPQLTWSSMTELYRTCIRFYKPLADICGSVGAGLYLSYLLQRQSFTLRNPPSNGSAVELFPGEFVYRPEQARIALCLGSKTQRNAREKLKAAGFIKEGRASHELVATRVNLAAIASCLQAQGERTIRKSAPRKRPVLDTPRDLALVPAACASDTGTSPLLRRANSQLSQRQLNLFSPVGRISKWHLDRVADDQLAPPDDAASLFKPKLGPVSSPTGLVLSLFAPGLEARSKQQEAAATAPSTSASASRRNVGSQPEHQPRTKLSTNSDASGNHVALLSSAIRPFVDPNLPFCRNYKEQGISRFFQTTTSWPVDDSGQAKAGRCRVEKTRGTEIPNQEAAIDRKTLAATVTRASGGDLGQSSGVVGRTSDWSTQQLILPELLDVAMHSAVLATVSKAPSELRQAFLDELAGHLGIPNKTIHNPAGWLHRLIQRHATGYVDLAMASQVAVLRLRKRRHQERMDAALSSSLKHGTGAINEARPLGNEEVASDSEVKKIHRLRLQELKAQFSRQQGSRK